MPKTEGARVVIGIVTYNHRKFIEQCLDSVPGSSKLNSIKVILVDNRSSDGLVEFVRDRYSWVEVVEQKSLNSFAFNNNLAFACLASEYFLMLNPDTVLDEGAVDILVDFMERHPHCGICGPRLVFPDGSLQHSCRRFPTVWSTLLRRSPLRLLFPREFRGVRHLMAADPHDKEMAVDWMLGACLLVRREVIIGTKLLDEAFPLYCEEIDLCFRLKKRGWAVHYVPSATVVHHHLAKSDSKLFCRESMLHARSMLHFLNKHYISLDGDVDGVCGVNRRSRIISCPDASHRS